MSGREDAPSSWRGNDGEEPPPFLGRWRNVYLLVLGELVLLVIVFALLRAWAS